MFEKFPYTNLHELNLDWIINKLREIESAAVLSVNGQTGDVVLYQDALVVFPPVTDNQWNIYRQVGNTGDTSIEGIQFIKGQPAQRIAGLQRYNIYDQGNPPPYPVTSVQGQTGNVVIAFPVSSVNGLTGDVVLYQNPVIQYPTTDQNTWNLYRIVTGSDSTTEAAGIQFIKGQAAQRIAGLQRYDIYDQGNPPPYPVSSVNGQTGAVMLTFPVTSVNGQTGDVIITIPVTSVNGQTGAVTIPPFVTDQTVALMDVDTVVSGATQWALSRNIKLGSTVNTADVGILFDTETDGTLKAYIRKKIGNTVTTEKILTPADIPSDTGVISVNGASGVVSLDGDDIPSTYGSALSVSDVLSGHTLDITDLQNQADAIEQNLADYYSASADYAIGDLVIRNDRLWKCNTAITGGEAWNANHWNQTTVANELGAINASSYQKVIGTTSVSLPANWKSISILAFLSSRTDLGIELTVHRQQIAEMISYQQGLSYNCAVGATRGFSSSELQGVNYIFDSETTMHLEYYKYQSGADHASECVSCYFIRT